MNLYGIISLESFIDLLHNKREQYVRPALWDDNHEGYLFTKINNEEDRRKIIEDMYYNNVCPRNYKATIDNLLKRVSNESFLHKKKAFKHEAQKEGCQLENLWKMQEIENDADRIAEIERRLNQYGVLCLE